MFARLPISGRVLRFREPDGVEEAIIAELPLARPAKAGIALLEALARDGDTGAPIDAGALVVTDFEAALAALRAARFGDAMATAAPCDHCGEWIEIGFSLAALIAAGRPGRPGPGVLASPDGDGYAIGDAAFRLPSAGVQREAERAVDPAAYLWSACVATPAAPRRRIEAAMARLAPLLSRLVASACPSCGGACTLLIHVPSLVTTEFARDARDVFDDVDTLAGAYGWGETEILALPTARRRRYAARIARAA